MAATFDSDKFVKFLALTKPSHRNVYPSVSPQNPSLSAAGKIVLVTGASRGVGLGIAPVWAEAGAAGIVVTARDVSTLDAVTKAIRAKSESTEVLPVACEISNEESVRNLFEKIKERFGKLDVVVANAGVNNVKNGDGIKRIGEGDVRRWAADINVNIIGTYLTAHHYIATFGPTGTFIAFSSAAPSVTMPGWSSYGIAKHACIRIAEYLALEYPTMRAFALNPGMVKGTDTDADLTPFALDEQELVGGFTLWLASPKSEGVRGGWLNVNWDVDVLERNAEKIAREGLVKTGFLNAKLGGEGLLE